MNRYILIILSLFNHFTISAQEPFNTHIQLHLSAFNKEYDSLLVEIKLFDSFLGSYYHSYQSFLMPTKDTSIDLMLPEVSIGIIEIKRNNKEISGSGTTVFSGDSLVGKLGIYKEFIIRGGENGYMQENFMLPFNLPSIIKNHSAFKPKMVHRNYDLKIPEDPMLQAIYLEYLRNVISLVKEKSGSYHILSRLLTSADNITLKVLDTAYSMFDERILNTTYGRRLKTYIANGKWLLNNNSLSEVKVETTGGEKESLASILDSTKFTYIDFWASWCAPCREFNRQLVNEYDSLDTTKIQIVSISIDDDLIKWKAAIANDKLPWKNLIDPSKNGFKGDLAILFNIQYIPQSFLFDKNGNIVALNLRINEILRIGK